MRVGNPERIDARALNITAASVAAGRVRLLEEEANSELKRMLRELDANKEMRRERKVQTRAFL